MASGKQSPEQLFNDSILTNDRLGHFRSKLLALNAQGLHGFHLIGCRIHGVFLEWTEGGLTYVGQTLWEMESSQGCLTDNKALI